MIMLGEGAATAGLCDWVNGGGRQRRGRRLWQNSSDAAAPSLSEWKVDGATGVAS